MVLQYTHYPNSVFENNFGIVKNLLRTKIQNVGSPNIVCFLTSLHDFTINVFFCPQMQFFSTQTTSSTTEAFKIPCAILPQKVTLLNLCKHFLEITSFFSVYFHCFDLSTSIQSMLFPTLFSLFLIFTKEMTLEARLPRLNVIYYSKS